MTESDDHKRALAIVAEHERPLREEIARLRKLVFDGVRCCGFDREIHICRHAPDGSVQPCVHWRDDHCAVDGWEPKR